MRDKKCGIYLQNSCSRTYSNSLNAGKCGLWANLRPPEECTCGPTMRACQFARRENDIFDLSAPFKCLSFCWRHFLGPMAVFGMFVCAWLKKFGSYQWNKILRCWWTTLFIVGLVTLQCWWMPASSEPLPWPVHNFFCQARKSCSKNLYVRCKGSCEICASLLKRSERLLFCRRSLHTSRSYALISEKAL